MESDLPIIIGREPDCGIFVDDALVSRRHLHLSLAKGKLVVTDQSTNGTSIELTVPGGKPGQVYAHNEAIVLTDEAGKFRLGPEASRKGAIIFFRILRASSAAAPE